jgi:hypothetical protein
MRVSMNQTKFACFSNSGVRVRLVGRSIDFVELMFQPGLAYAFLKIHSFLRRFRIILSWKQGWLKTILLPL